MMFDPISRLSFILTPLLCTLLFFLVATGIQAQAKSTLAPVNALREIAKELGKNNWNFSLNPCGGDPSWNTKVTDTGSQFKNSVLCDCSYPGGVCHVAEIVLKGQDLAGVLPPSLVKLPKIKKIDLSFNYLNDTIPPQWASTNLAFLAVTANRLSGSIPTSLGKITSLVTVILENNKFFGTVPAELGNLTNLSVLVLSANNFTGKLPEELNRLTNLTELRISSNNFSGKIPNLGNCTKLQKLEIQGSGLEGQIPETLSFLRKITELRISDLSGEGSHFPNLSRMANMTKLMLRSCNIIGTIPGYISQMSNLSHLDLSFNNLNGDIPDLSEKHVKKIYLTGNSLEGSLPKWIADKDLVDLSYNNFSKDTVPQDCSESLNLFRSYSSGNNSDLVKCHSSLQCLEDYYSVYINCGGPGVTIGNKTYEADEYLGGPANFFPSSDRWGFSNTGSIWSGDNSDSHYIENNASVLTMNDYELYTRARHTLLSLTYYGRCLANGKYTVTLHFAEIVFRDSQSYKSLGRRVFDVYVQGVTKLKNFDIKIAAGGVDKEVNITLKGILVTNKTLEVRFQYAGKGTTAVPLRGAYGPLISAISMVAEFKPISHGKIAHGKIPQWKKYAFVAIGVVAAALCLSFLILGIAWKRGYIGDQNSREKDLRGLDLQTGVFTYRQIKAATDNFADSNKLGEGGFGSVYMGTLLDGTPIAVKKLSSKSKQGNREFVNEIGMIAGIQHPNVVRLYGCCVEGNHLLLVYEYMENNSLAHALFEHNNSKLESDWPTRQRICVGIAKGLTFLHEDSVLKMVHRDIKATNVLLDADLTPKISDFGLAKLDEEENTHITTRVAGTIGYMAPEYALRGYLTYKADVYSFGVLALEIVVGKSNMKYRPTEDYYCLLDWAVVLQQKGKLIDLVDPRLGSEFNKKEAVRMIKIALLCTNKAPALRPTMSEVVNMLEGRTKIKEPNMNRFLLNQQLSARTTCILIVKFLKNVDVYWRKHQYTI
ncbi:unnamed protein product [Lactuca saligna]|uniref:non-specific serine/threonine protein kinase n=1 Tax=Lactuca saligna TaxID=75948 RepID=A0AA35YSE5_LACSI|nr:unnamed protein product [Lactuca saligna]